MSKSASLRIVDLRRIHQIVHECRDLGDDGEAWRDHYARESAEMIDADFGSAWIISGMAEKKVVVEGTREWGWHNGFDQAGWLCSVREFTKDPFYSAPYRIYYDCLLKEDGICLQRTDMLRDHKWYKSFLYEIVLRAMGGDHYLWCWRMPPGNPRQHHGVSIARLPRRDKFTLREKAVIRELQALTAPLLGGALAQFHEPSPRQLPPRTKEVLNMILEGDGDKQIAARLGITTHTVRDHAKLIHRHFGTRTRHELMARWIRRGWGVHPPTESDSESTD